MNEHRNREQNYTYFLECADGSYYAGWTKDLEGRLKAHNAGSGSKYTRSKLPVKLVYWEAFSTKEEAMKREAGLKRLTRVEKRRLIQNFTPNSDSVTNAERKAGEEEIKMLKTIETKRLILRPWTEDDAADLFEYAKNPNVGPHAGWKPHESIEESLEIIKTIFMPITWAVIYKDNGKVIGSIGYLQDKKRDDGLDVLEMGYALSEDYWGKGLMTEAAFAAVSYAFDVLKLKVLTISRNPLNLRSGRVIEKCGFTYEGTLRRANRVEFLNEIRDVACYSMTNEEYASSELKKSSSV